MTLSTFVKFSKSMTEISLFSVFFLILSSRKHANKISEGPLEVGCLIHGLYPRCRQSDKLLTARKDVLIVCVWKHVNKFILGTA